MVKYNDDIPYDYVGKYDDGGAFIYPPASLLPFTKYAPKVSSGKSIGVPFYSFPLTQYAPDIRIGFTAKVPLTSWDLVGGGGFYLVETIQTSGDPIPSTHVEDAYKLDADAYVDLFQVTLSDGVSKLFLKNNSDVSWQGNDYEGTVIKIEGVSLYSDDTASRPSLEIYNPEGVYSYFVDSGLLEGASVARYRVLKTHLDADLPIYRRQQWKIFRISALTKHLVKVELRDMTDGQHFMVPAGMYIPPNYPTVSIS